MIWSDVVECCEEYLGVDGVDHGRLRCSVRERDGMMAKYQRRYPPELKKRACRLVFDWRKARQRSIGGFTEIGEQLDVHPETLRGW